MAEPPEQPTSSTKTGECEAWLRDYLASRHAIGLAWVPKADVLHANGGRWSERTIERAFSERIGGRTGKDFGDRATWALPTTD